MCVCVYLTVLKTKTDTHSIKRERDSAVNMVLLNIYSRTNRLLKLCQFTERVQPVVTNILMLISALRAYASYISVLYYNILHNISSISDLH